MLIYSYLHGLLFWICPVHVRVACALGLILFFPLRYQLIYSVNKYFSEWHLVFSCLAFRPAKGRYLELYHLPYSILIEMALFCQFCVGECQSALFSSSSFFFFFLLKSKIIPYFFIFQQSCNCLLFQLRCRYKIIPFAMVTIPNYGLNSTTAILL